LEALQESHSSQIQSLSASHFRALAELQDAHSVSLAEIEEQHSVELEAMVDSYDRSKKASVPTVKITQELDNRVSRLARRVQFAPYRYRRARRASDNRNIRYMALVTKIRNLAAQDASSIFQFDGNAATATLEVGYAVSSTSPAQASAWISFSKTILLNFIPLGQL